MATKYVNRNRRRKLGNGSWETIRSNGTTVSRTTKSGGRTETKNYGTGKTTTTYNNGQGQATIYTSDDPSKVKRRRAKKDDPHWIFGLIGLAIVAWCFYYTGRPS